MVDWNNKLVSHIVMEPNVRGRKKSSSFLYIILFLILIGLGYFAYRFVNKEKEVDSETGNTPEVIQDNSDDEEVINPDVDENLEEEDEEDSDTGVVDFSKFSLAAQSVGSSSDNTDMFYTLSTLTNSAQEGFHRFEFTFMGKQEDSNTPYAVASYVPSLGAIRVDFSGVTTDNSGIGYQKSLDINKEGVIKIYHNVSADQTQELYDIGVSKETTFYFSSTENGENSWTITLDVRYPGASETEGTLDLGSDEFSKDMQSLSGASSAEGARVSSYSYSASGGVLRVVFEVKGSSSKPIPSVEAEYEGDSLVMRFPSVVSDAIAKMPSSQSMGGGINMLWEMDGSNMSKYTFENASKEFKLYGSTNPNQVVIEIRL